MRWLDSIGQNTPDDFKVAVSMGHVPGWRAFLIHGHNPDISGTEDLWAAGGVRTLPLSAGVASVVSSSASDTALGAGARALSIEGLDASYNEITEIVTLNGLTPVLTVNQFFRINKATCTTCGGSSNIGNLSITVGGNLQAYIPAAAGVTSQLVYSVPAGHSFIIDRYVASASPNNTASNLEILSQARLFNPASANSYEAWRTTSNWMVGTVSFNNEGSRPIPEKSDYRVQAKCSGASSRVTVSIGGYIVKRGFD